jgi:hypothetical protein
MPPCFQWLYEVLHSVGVASLDLRDPATDGSKKAEGSQKKKEKEKENVA